MTNVRSLQSYKHQLTRRLIEHAARATYQKLAKPCPCGKAVCVCRGDDWPRDAA